jgi:hypothetical protein
VTVDAKQAAAPARQAAKLQDDKIVKKQSQHFGQLSLFGKSLIWTYMWSPIAGLFSCWYGYYPCPN